MRRKPKSPYEGTGVSVSTSLAAVAGGVLSLEEAMLAHVEDPGTGRTVAEIVGRPLLAALPSGEAG